MSGWMGRRVFSAGESDFLWQDIVAAAILRGDWARLTERVRRRLEAARRAEQAMESPSDGVVEAAAQEFRYARDLVAAEDMESWLARWDLTVDDWMDYVERSVIAESRDSEEIEISAAAQIGEQAEEELAGCIEAEAVCSGELTQFAATLAGRVAIDELCSEGEEGEVPDDADAAAAAAEIAEAAAGFHAVFALSGLAETLAPDAGRIAELARLELVFQKFRPRLATPAAVRAQIEMRRMDWIRFELAEIAFADEGAAREAALCVREDGSTLETASARAHVPIREIRATLETLDPEARPLLLSARPGDLVGPMRLEDRFCLLLVRGKTMPSEGDPELEKLAQDPLVARVVEQEMNQRVRWDEQP